MGAGGPHSDRNKVTTQIGGIRSLRSDRKNSRACGGKNHQDLSLAKGRETKKKTVSPVPFLREGEKKVDAASSEVKGGKV